MKKLKGKKDTQQQEAPETSAKSKEKRGQLEVSVRKIDLHAKNSFQIYKLENTSDHFIPCTIKEEKEAYLFTYDMTNQTYFSEIPVKDFGMKFKALIQAIHIIQSEPEYAFPMNPDNFCIDQQGVVRILQRDILVDERDEQTLFKEFTALSASLLQGKYSYEDVLQGGDDLLKGSERTKSLMEWKSFADAKTDLEKKLKKYESVQKSNFQTVKKTNYVALRVALICFVLIALVSGGLYIYQQFWILKPQEQALIAERAFTEKDYVSVIEALREEPLEDMQKAEKYVLAVSYVRSQSIDNFSNTEKEKITSKLTPEGGEAEMEFWIHLGRLELDVAEDIAIQLSDNQKLLYVYLVSLDNVSTDDSLSASEKSSKISELQGNIKQLSEELGLNLDTENINAAGEETDSTADSTNETNSSTAASSEKE